MPGRLLRQAGRERVMTMAVYKRSEESLIASIYKLNDERDSSLRLLTPKSPRVPDQSACEASPAWASRSVRNDMRGVGFKEQSMSHKFPSPQ